MPYGTLHINKQLKKVIDVEKLSESILFIPGTLCDERIWLPVWQQLQIEHRLYAPLQWASTLDEMLALTEDRIEEAEGKVHIVAYSMGGYIAGLCVQKCAIKSPDKIASITLIAYDPYGLSKEETAARQQLSNTISKNPKMKLNKAHLTQYFTNDEMSQPSLVQPVLGMHSDLGAKTLLNQINASTPRKDLSTMLTKHKIPLLLIAGKEDKIAQTERLSKFCAQNKHAQMHLENDTAHMILLTKPALVAQKLSEFISAQQATL